MGLEILDRVVRLVTNEILRVLKEAHISLATTAIGIVIQGTLVITNSLVVILIKMIIASKGGTQPSYGFRMM